MNAANAIVKKAHDLLPDVLNDFSSLKGWRLEQIGEHLSRYLDSDNSLENVQRLARPVLFGSHHELPSLDRELDRIRNAMNARRIPTQIANRTEVDKLKQMLMATESVDLELYNVVQMQQSRTVSIPSRHAICMIAAMKCGYRPTAEKYLLDLEYAIKPSVERGRLLMTPLIPRWLRNAMVPILVRDKDNAVDGFMTGDRWLYRTGADCRSADAYPVYESYSKSRPPGRIIPFMPSDHIQFKADSYLLKFLRALFRGRDRGTCRTLDTYLAYFARTCCVPQGRVMARI
ncbi:hypothetical protein BWQ96_10169 [Gracilariopsis chorda]|uniref:Uncharacterized protein n=1 Tax=Gracilariopsis chorda TaxID=448386 RepID=A0A2V3IDK4_9FLOR|nr:hypothetical protein BWQ96_10169 [Gracilariopsis chorda]|eukprot:PXF40131.1 hypothetical protein BWQ96_10169 [Gracilariopsis chorda]